MKVKESERNKIGEGRMIPACDVPWQKGCYCNRNPLRDARSADALFVAILSYNCI